ncbi:MAG: hypothetical protein Q4B42_00810, partial [Oscillospiraceae bacterium]|nr:hypothetical protein [Oscillospiraceae bacterium]
MTLAEKVAFLKGLIEGSELNLEEKQQKVLDAVVEVLSEAAQSISEIDEDISTICDEIEGIYGELDDIEEDLDELYDVDMDGDEFMYDVTCANCGETVCVGEDTLTDGEMVCPNCGETIEFELEEDFGDSDGEE